VDLRRSLHAELPETWQTGSLTTNRNSGERTDQNPACRHGDQDLLVIPVERIRSTAFVLPCAVIGMA
jgi:hypothetical protein